MSRFAPAIVTAFALAWGLPTASGPAAAGGLSKARAEMLARQKRLIEGRLATQYSDSTRRAAGARQIPRYAGSYRGPYFQIAQAAARKAGVPEDLFARLVQTESGWDPKAVSPKGAVGLAQLMPETAARLGADPTDPVENLEAGARYLRQMFDRFGSWRLALAAYNAGPEAVEKHNGVPPFAETQGYVVAILGR